MTSTCSYCKLPDQVIAMVINGGSFNGTPIQGTCLVCHDCWAKGIQPGDVEDDEE